MKTTTCRRLAGALATAAAGAVLFASPALAATAPHYYANDVAGTGRFGPAITGTAMQEIATQVSREERDPAEFAAMASYHHFRLGGGVQWLIAHPAQWHAEAVAFGKYLDSNVREEVHWTSPYKTEYAVPHGSQPATFGWTQMPSLTRDVLVFADGADQVENCGDQPYIPRFRIPLPSQPKPVTCKNGKHGKTCSVPCAAGTKLFNVPGVGRMCLCQTTVHVIVSQTRTVSVEVITTVTDTTSTTTQVSYGVCAPKKPCKTT